MGYPRQKTSSKPLTDFIERMGLTKREFAKAAHLNESTVNHWISKNNMPPHIHLVMEALQRRSGNGAAANAGKIVVCQSHGPLASNTPQVLEALGLKVVAEFNTLDAS